MWTGFIIWKCCTLSKTLEWSTTWLNNRALSKEASNHMELQIFIYIYSLILVSFLISIVFDHLGSFCRFLCDNFPFIPPKSKEIWENITAAYGKHSLILIIKGFLTHSRKDVSTVHISKNKRQLALLQVSTQ